MPCRAKIHCYNPKLWAAPGAYPGIPGRATYHDPCCILARYAMIDSRLFRNSFASSAILNRFDVNPVKPSWVILFTSIQVMYWLYNETEWEVWLGDSILVKAMSPNVCMLEDVDSNTCFRFSLVCSWWWCSCCKVFVDDFQTSVVDSLWFLPCRFFDDANLILALFLQAARNALAKMCSMITNNFNQISIYLRRFLDDVKWCA